MISHFSWKCSAAAAMLFCAVPFPSQAKDNSPEVKHVLVLSFDGLHAIDLANYIQSNPNSSFAELAKHGVRYSNATSSKPSDSFPGILAIVTGGSPNSTGVWYDDAYDRKLSPPLVDQDGVTPLGDKNCSVIGTEVLMDQTIDKNPNVIDGGGGINEDRLPRDPSKGCSPVYPWMYSRVNNIFEIVKKHGGTTAWSDKHLGAYMMLFGPSGKGLDDYYSPEVDSRDSLATSSVEEAIKYDDLKRDAVLNWIKGLDHTGKKWIVPTLFGSNFQEVSVGQKVTNAGYIDEVGTPSAELSKALAHADQDIWMFINALKSEGIYDETLIVLATKHGQSPIDKSRLQTKNTGVKDPADFLGTSVAFEMTDSVSLIWLTDSALTDVNADILQQNQQAIHAEKIYSGNTLQLLFNDPKKDSRVPDIIVQPNLGVIYTKNTAKIAEHGGFSTDDTSVGLLFSIPGLGQRVIKGAVDNRMVAPSILRALGLNPWELQAVQMENTPSLPALTDINR